MSVAAVLFDLDDTLIDWEGSVDRCIRDLGGDDVADQLLAYVRQHHWKRRDGFVVHRNTWKVHEEAEQLGPTPCPTSTRPSWPWP